MFSVEKYSIWHPSVLKIEKKKKENFPLAKKKRKQRVFSFFSFEKKGKGLQVIFSHSLWSGMGSMELGGTVFVMFLRIGKGSEASCL